MQIPARAATARGAVIRHITERARRFPRFDPMTEGDPAWAAALVPAERSLAVALDHVVARHWLTLQALIEPGLSRPWTQTEPRVQAALLVGAAQLVYLDSVPDYAAINETVETAARMIRPGAGKLVNAVLHRVCERRGEIIDRFAHEHQEENAAGVGADDNAARDLLPLPDGRAWAMQPGTLPPDPIDRLAVQCGCRRWMVQQWVQQFGLASARELAMHSLVHAPLIITGSDSPPPDLATRPHDDAGFFIIEHGSGDQHRAMIHDLLQPGSPWRVQDPGTARAVELTATLQPAVIVDYCAGRGTKTRQLLAQHPQAQMICTDVHPERRAALHAAFRDHERVTVIDPAQRLEHAGRADLLVLDVPCSNSGVLARRVEARYRVTERELGELVNTQRQIVADTLPLLTDGGHLLYVTCSIDDRENVEQREWITHWHHMPCAREHRALPSGLPSDPLTCYRDGGYAALLKREAMQRR